jgi:glycosyltransferase involved in cell wall biosynthesis
VLHVDAGNEMRGGQWQCLRLVESQGPEATLLAAAGSPLARMAVERGVDVQPLNMARLLRLARHCDLIHVHDARAHAWAAAAGGAPLIVSRRVVFPIQRSPLSRWKYSRAAHYIAVSDCVRRSLLAGGVRDDRITVVYDGVPLPAEPATPECIIAPASDDPVKGSSLAAEASSLAGVSLLFSNDLERDLRRARLFLYITLAEGLGSGALLAMAFGAAVVASRVGGLPELIDDGVNGVLTENDPNAIAAALRRACDDAERLGSEARRTVERRFTVATMVEGTLAVYRKVLASC